jgi:hypothetical protein
MLLRRGTSDPTQMEDTASAPTSTVELSAPSGSPPTDPALPRPDAGPARLPKKRSGSGSATPLAPPP